VKKKSNFEQRKQMKGKSGGRNEQYNTEIGTEDNEKDREVPQGV
jgi:hypothetical protein